MKSALITLGFLLATAQAGSRSLKSLLQTDDVPAPSTSAPTLQACSCDLASNTTDNLPVLDQSVYTTYNTNQLVNVDSTLISVPDTRNVAVVAN